LISGYPGERSFALIPDVGNTDQKISSNNQRELLMQFRLRQILQIASLIVIAGVSTNSYASCSCIDWMNKAGYCVDYVKEKIPEFPIPQNAAEIASLKNKEISEITEGDVAIFKLRNYWHVAYVEKVHRNQQDIATAIDVSEMNFGDQMSFDEFRASWKSNNVNEWKRAICCGVTDKYDQMSFRKYVALDTVKQIWSPDSVESEIVSIRKARAVVDKAKEVLNLFIDFVRG
jgi:hypothetical protein